MQHFVRPEEASPVNGYSHAVSFPGEMVAVSGQVPGDREGNVVGGEDTEAQVRQALAVIPAEA